MNTCGVFNFTTGHTKILHTYGALALSFTFYAHRPLASSYFLSTLLIYIDDSKFSAGLPGQADTQAHDTRS